MYHYSGPIQLLRLVHREGQPLEVTALASDIIEMRQHMTNDMYQWYLDWVPPVDEDAQ